MKNKLILKSAVFSVFIYIIVLVSCGGGGGGAGGASIPASEYTTHNTGGWGGGGSSGGSSGSGGNGVNVSISGGTPLNVTGYTYNGQTYPTVEALRDAIATDAFPYGTTSVDFTCTTAGGSTETRTARITKTADGNNTNISIEHQYKASITVNGTDITIPFYKNDGISLTDIAALIGNETIDAGMSSEVVFELQKVKIGGVEYPTNGTIPASAISGNGDVTITGAQGVYEKWGISSGSPKVIQFSSSLNNGDSITISTTEPITNIYPPNDKQISLDLSGMSVSNTTYIQNFINPPSAVTELVLPNDIETLNTNAFSGCTNLTSITMSNNVQTIGNNAFSACINLTSITIPDSVTTIGTDVFFNCNELQSITLPNNTSFTEIPDQFFEYLSKLESITIPNNVTKIGSNAFLGCERLQSVTLPNNPGFTEIEAGAFQNCKELESITIPDSVTTIGWSAFFGCERLQSVTLPNNPGFTEIGTSLFEGCESLESISIPASVTTIGQDAFKDCTSLESITGRGNTFSLTADAFAGCTNLSRLYVSTPQYITISSNVFSSLDSTKRVIIDLGSVNQAIAANNKLITLQGSGTFTKTPHLNSNTTVYANHFSISGSTWGSKQIIVKPSTSFDYYTWNGTGFDTTSTAPDAWND